MKITEGELGKYLSSYTIDVKTLAAKGIECHEIASPSQHLAALQIVTIQQITKHPDVPDLTLVHFIYDAEQVTAVCGDTRLKVGDRCICIKAGQKLPSTGKKLKARTIAGITSEYMLCSAQELGGQDDTGVLVTTASDPVTAVYPDGATYEFEITYNRGDLLSVRGLARELVGLDLAKWHEDMMHVIDHPIALMPRTIYDAHAIAADVMRLYALFEFKQVDKGSAELIAISNLIMSEIGQPNHVFDLDKLQGKIRVRYALSGEEFIDLFGKTHILDDKILIIADDVGPVAIAGVIGGLRASCTADTCNIVLEIAHFDPATISYAVEKLNLYTKSANFFMHHVDYSRYTDALVWFEKLLGQKHDSAHILQYIPLQSINIAFDHVLARKIVPTFDQVSFEQMLAKHGFHYDGVIVRPPSFRSDILSSHDLIREYVRIVGIDQTPMHIVAQQSYDHDVDLSLWYHECRHLNLANEECSITLYNPMTGASGLRSTLLEQLTRTCLYNLSKGQQFNGLYEQGFVWPTAITCQGDIPTYEQVQHLAIVDTGDLSRLKHVLQNLYSNLTYKPYHHARFKYCSQILFKKRVIGVIGELAHNLKEKVQMFGLEIALLERQSRSCANFKPYHYVYKKDFTIRTMALAQDIIKTAPCTLEVLDCYKDCFVDQPRNITFRALIQADNTLDSERIKCIEGEIAEYLEQYV